MTITLALAGDTMLGRGVAERLGAESPQKLVSDEIVEIVRGADLFVLNLECCVSERGRPWAAPGKPFFFRAPPAAVDLLVRLGVDCVTLANNHALDYGPDALADTFEHLSSAGVEFVGAGTDLRRARAPAVLEAAGFRMAVLGITDHPADFAASPEDPGVAFVDLEAGLPEWVAATVGEHGADGILVTPHWGPNMVAEPVPSVRAAARSLVEQGATLVAGHSAHVFHGAADRVLFDLGDFLDDYAVDPVLRNDLGLLWLVDLDEQGPVRVEAVPLELDYCFTGVATGEDLGWIERRFAGACRALGTEVTWAAGRAIIELR